jgi:SAM-dependent methyltransferase
VKRTRIVGLRVYQFVSGSALDPLALGRRVIEAPYFVANLVRYLRRQPRPPSSFRLRLRYLYPALGDRHAPAGDASGHYFHQDIWAARQIHENAPGRHVDVGSSVAGFIAHLLTFREVEYVDIRPLRTNVTGLHYRAGSLLALPYASDSLESLSALHVAEHIGLGRYGDAVDPDGWRKAVDELKRVLRPGGSLYFSVPIGKERLEFDGHRVFDPKTVIAAFEPLSLVKFAYVDDDGDYVEAADPDGINGWYGCGLFLFSKEASAGTGGSGVSRRRPSAPGGRRRRGGPAREPGR